MQLTASILKKGSEMKNNKNDAKSVFLRKGTCAQTYAFILNREFGHTDSTYEKATDLLAGGLYQNGHQCGMLWGSSIAIGTEAFRRYGNSAKGIYLSISATQSILQSFSSCAATVNCREVTGCDFTKKKDLIIYILKVMLSGFYFSRCFNLAEKWFTDSINTAVRAVEIKTPELSDNIFNCASEVVKRMGGGDKEIASVAGFAGGLGLSANACGALAAAIWMKSLVWCRNNPDRNPPYLKNQVALKLISKFKSETGSKLLCKDICAKKFNSIEEHSEFIKNGGCQKLIRILAEE